MSEETTEKLSDGELEYWTQAQALAMQATQQAQQAEATARAAHEQAIAAQGARTSYAQYLMRKHGLNPEDQVLEDGRIVRKESAPPPPAPGG